MKTSPIDSRNAGLRNEQLVIALLKEHGALSQAQLCKLAGLSSSTASYIVGRLREKGLIQERPGQSVKRGAKPVIVSICPTGRFVAGVEISPTRVFIGLFNFVGEIVDAARAPLRDDHTPRHVVDVLEINLRGLLGKHKVSEPHLLGVGLTLSGSIGADGVVELSSPLGWKNVPLRELVQARFEVPVSVHTTRVRLLAELSVRPDLSSKNLLCLNVAHGVGVHMVVDGHLLHGAGDRCGELGHVVFDPNGPACGCGQRGCLEAFISGPALATRIQAAVAAGRCPAWAETLDPEDIPETIVRKWGDALEQNDSFALELRDFLADFVSRATAMAINCFDPDVVILQGYVCEQCPDTLINAIRRRFETDVYDHQARSVQVLPAVSGDEALIRGAAAAALQKAAAMV